jgi:RNA polymerase sigma-70 factor (ECF subfamily)
MDWEASALDRLNQVRDLDAFAAIYDAHSPLVYRICCLVLRDEQEAQDVCQEIFTKFWEKPAAYDAGRGSLKTYLGIQARSRAIDRLRSRRRREKRVALAPAAEQSLEALALRNARPNGPNALDSAQERQRREKMLALLDALPPVQAQALRLAFYEGLSHRELAERLGEPLGTVKTRLRRGLERLSALLGPDREEWQ